MKIKIIIPELEKNTTNPEDFQYSLGYLVLKTKETEISFFGNKYCMIFLSISELLQIIEEISVNKNSKIKWVGQDSGYSFIVSIAGKKIIFEGNDYILKFKLKKFQKKLNKSIRKYQDFLK